MLAGTADRIKGIGPHPQPFDIERATKESPNFRSVIWSGRHRQVMLMSIPAGCDNREPRARGHDRVRQWQAAAILFKS